MLETITLVSPLQTPFVFKVRKRTYKFTERNIHKKKEEIQFSVFDNNPGSKVTFSFHSLTNEKVFVHDEQLLITLFFINRS